MHSYKIVEVQMANFTPSDPLASARKTVRTARYVGWVVFAAVLYGAAAYGHYVLDWGL